MQATPPFLIRFHMHLRTRYQTTERLVSKVKKANPCLSACILSQQYGSWSYIKGHIHHRPESPVPVHFPSPLGVLIQKLHLSAPNDSMNLIPRLFLNNSRSKSKPRNSCLSIPVTLAFFSTSPVRLPTGRVHLQRH
jgi:hypothetical protein